MKVLVTGGTGYIGSHICVELLDKGYELVVVDNLSNSKDEVINCIKKITNKDITFYKIDLRNYEDLRKVFEANKIEQIIHLAGSKSVGESVSNPVHYYENNISSVLNILKIMLDFKIKNLIFSSSAAIYDEEETPPYSEKSKIGNCKNPYAWSKFMIEIILKDFIKAHKDYKVVSLRYFNPVGAHESYLIGEFIDESPSNLVPYIDKVATGKLEYLNVFGNDYNTKDGTGVRDYIHVVDLARGHVEVIKKVTENGLYIYNLGTGKGTSVLDVIKTYEKSNNVNIPYKIIERREGDLAISFADTHRVRKELDFIANKKLSDMCIDSYKWALKKGEIKND